MMFCSICCNNDIIGLIHKKASLIGAKFLAHILIRVEHFYLQFLIELNYCFTEVPGHGKENGSFNSALSPGTFNKKAGLPAFNDGGTAISRFPSQRLSGEVSEASVLTARHASARSSGLLSRMVSTMNEEVSREYLGKVADLLLEFAKADTTVKSYMCSQSLLIRLFQMFHKIEPPVLLKVDL